MNLTNIIFPVAFLILFAAKIFGYLQASWWIVFLPLMIPFGILAALLAFMGIVITIAKYCER